MNLIASIMSAMIVGGVFLWLALSAVAGGLGNVDDGFFALAARAVADGVGYGIWISDGSFSPFDPYNGVGPVLIIPIAVFTYILGPRDWLPGAVSLGMFLAEIVWLFLVLRPASGTRRALDFVSALLLALILACSLVSWPFGVALGEPASFGFMALGLVLLALRRSYVLAGLCLGLAFLTKQIAAVPISGALLAWLAFQRPKASGIMLVGLTGLAPVVLFEIGKLIILGVDGYFHLAAIVAATTVTLAGNGSGSASDRILRTVESLRGYFRPSTLPVFAASIIPVFGRDLRLVIPTISAIGMHALYFVFVSNLWTRYAWFAIALLCLLSACMTLSIPRAVSTMPICSFAFIVWAVWVPGNPVALQHVALNVAALKRDRLDAVAVLDGLPKLPIASQHWSGMDELLYLVKERRQAVYEPSVNTLRGKEMAAVVSLFSDQHSRFVAAVRSTCLGLLRRERVEIYRCGAEFWKEYPQ